MSVDNMLPSNISSYSEYSMSFCGDIAHTFQSKPYLMCTAADATSAIMDFSKQKVDDGVVDSPPERRAGITPVASPSRLKRMGSFGEPKTNLTPQRQLYGDEEVELNQVKEVVLNSSILVHTSSFPVKPSCMANQHPSISTKRQRLQSTRSFESMGARKPPNPSTGLQTWSLSVQPRLPISTSIQMIQKSPSCRGRDDNTSCLSCGSHPLSLRHKRKDTNYMDYYENSPFAPRRKAILAAHARLKAEEALRLKAREV
jgi:hypothetical protein